MEKFKKRWGKEPDPYGVTNYDIVYVAAKAMEQAKDLFDKEEVNNILNSKDFSYEGIRGLYEFNDLQMAKYGPDYLTFCTFQEWIDENGNRISNFLFPLNYKDADFNLPPWYEAGLKKFGK